MTRLLASVVSVNLIIGLIGLVFIYWRSQDPSVVDLGVLGRTTDPAMTELLREDAAGAAMTWWTIVMVGVTLAALAFLLISWSKQPATPQQARSASVFWWLLLGVALTVAVAAGYWVYVNNAIAHAWRLSLVIGGMAAAPLAYFLSTAFGVKSSMSPSVALASLVRR